MQKLYLKFNDDWKEYGLFDGYFYMYNPLTSVSIALDNQGELFNVSCEILEDQNKVVMYSNYDVKELADEIDLFDIDYNTYFDKRWEEIPKAIMTVDNWRSLQKKWKKLLELQTQYVVFTFVKEGDYDKVDVFGKDELSEEDWEYIKQEHAKYLKYEKAKQKYIYNHPDYSDEIWRGPQDDEYEADIMKYYDQD